MSVHNDTGIAVRHVEIPPFFCPVEPVIHPDVEVVHRTAASSRSSRASWMSWSSWPPTNRRCPARTSSAAASTP